MEQSEAGRAKSKYAWNFAVGSNGLVQDGEHEPFCFRVAPVTAFGFKEGDAIRMAWRYSEV